MILLHPAALLFGDKDRQNGAKFMPWKLALQPLRAHAHKAKFSQCYQDLVPRNTFVKIVYG